jgi:hypothetical protein
MRRLARLRRPIATPFAIWADFALRAGTKVAVIPTADAPPAKAAPGRKPKPRRRAKR